MNILPLFIFVPIFIAAAIIILSRIFKPGIAVPLAITNSAILMFFCLFSILVMQYKRFFVFSMAKTSPLFAINLAMDHLSLIFLTIISVVSLMAAIYSISYMKKYNDDPKYFALLVLLIGGMNGVVLSADLLNLFLFMEMTALSAYALVAFGTRSQEIEAAFKYIVLGSLASMMILLGIALVYGFFGTLNMAQISKLIIGTKLSAGYLLALTLFIMGFGLKAALMPFHTWLPDAHTSAPAPISAMLSGLVIKTLGAYTLMRLIFNVFGLSPQISAVLMALGAFSMVLGIYLAIGQDDYKRLLAYSSISHMGYIFLGIGIATPLSLTGALFHIINHATFKPLLFMNAGAVEQAAGTRNLKELGGLSNKMPATTTTAVIGSMAISGVPPFNGFWSKLIIIIAAVSANHIFYAFLAVLSAVITLAAFLKVNLFVYFGKLKENFQEVKEAPLPMLLSMSFLAALCLLVGLFFPYVLNYLVSPAAEMLVLGKKYGILLARGALQ